MGFCKQSQKDCKLNLPYSAAEVTASITMEKQKAEDADSKLGNIS